MKKLTIIHDIGIKDRPVHNLPANPKLSHYARNNRKAGNLAEIVFWIQVHRKMFHGLDFDRQKVIGNYIVDFYVIIHTNYPALRAPLLKIRRGIGFERTEVPQVKFCCNLAFPLPMWQKPPDCPWNKLKP